MQTLGSVGVYLPRNGRLVCVGRLDGQAVIQPSLTGRLVSANASD